MVFPSKRCIEMDKTMYLFEISNEEEMKRFTKEVARNQLGNDVQ